MRVFDSHRQPASPSPQPNITSADDPPTMTPLFWALIVLTGVAAGLGAAGLMLLLRAVQHLAWSYTAGDFLQGAERSGARHRVLVLMLAGVVAGGGWYVLRRTTRESFGLTTAIWQHQGTLAFWRTLGNAVLSIVIVGLGASVGRESAPKEFGALVANKFSHWSKLSSSQRRLLVACGAGAGMSAVYNVPFGGALFAVEVLLGNLSLPTVLPALTSSLIATVVAWVYLPIRPTYVIPSYPLTFAMIVWAALIGPLAGLAATGYILLIAWAKAHQPKGWRLLPTTFGIFTALGIVAVAYPQVLGNGRDVVQAAISNRLSILVLAAVLLLKPLATAGCFRSGATGGLFTPTLTFGALFGGLLGHLWMMGFPGVASGNPGSYALIGAGAVLAAATEGPISSIALMLDLTHHVETLMIPLLLAVCGAMLVTRLVGVRSIYSANVKAPTAHPASEPRRT